MREIDSSLDIKALRKIQSNRVDITVARNQHIQLKNALQNIGLKVITLPSKGFADSVFIEDTCIIIKNTALITCPGAKSRRGEIEEIKSFMCSLHSFSIHNVVEKDTNIDGGDVLFTGNLFYAQ